MTLSWLNDPSSDIFNGDLCINACLSPRSVAAASTTVSVGHAAACEGGDSQFFLCVLVKQFILL